MKTILLAALLSAQTAKPSMVPRNVIWAISGIAPVVFLFVKHRLRVNLEPQHPHECYQSPGGMMCVDPGAAMSDFRK